METTVDKLRVLVVDDEEGMRLGIERVLKNFSPRVPQLEKEVSFAIDHAATGEAGLEKIDRLKPHILLLDNKLPAMNGIEVLDTLSKRNADILIIMITAYASIEIAVKATKCGAYDFLPKPFTPDELKTIMQKAACHVALTIHAKQLAEERKQVRFQFISVLAHELKSPINAVENYLNIIREKSAGDDPAVYEHMLERSLTRIEYMKKLIADLLDMTRIESGQRKRELAPVLISEIAETAIDSIEETAKKQGITIDLNVENERPFTADWSEIEIVLNNLISNAVKYNRENGHVSVNISFTGDEAEISVSDTGIGLREDEKKKLFNDFVRIKKEETKKILGSGLGLSIVKKIARVYNGSVSVESELNKGSKFTVILREDTQ
jgi:two-component system, sensor histidine kinase and response regulator